MSPIARHLLQPVYDWLTEGFATRDLEHARALLEQGVDDAGWRALASWLTVHRCPRPLLSGCRQIGPAAEGRQATMPASA
jgi:hypothetical protein